MIPKTRATPILAPCAQPRALLPAGSRVHKDRPCTQVRVNREPAGGVECLCGSPVPWLRTLHALGGIGRCRKSYSATVARRVMPSSSASGLYGRWAPDDLVAGICISLPDTEDRRRRCSFDRPAITDGTSDAGIGRAKR